MAIVFNPENATSEDFEQMMNDCLMDLTEEIKPPPAAIKIGTKIFGSYGDFSCIVAPAKAKKTFFKSLLVSGFIGSPQEYTGHIYGLDNKDKYVIEFDTEQSRHHSYRVFKRVEKMCGKSNPLYKCFYLREKTPRERFELINWILTESEYAEKGIGLVIIDGIADLIDDTNNLVQSNLVTTKLLAWSGSLQCHIITVLHRPNNSSKPTGHVGSSVLKKAETVAFIESDGEFTKVKAEYTRNQAFEEFRFFVADNDWLPRVEESFDVKF